MRSLLRTSTLATTAVAAVVAIYLVLSLAPATRRLAAPIPRTVVAGAYHIHSNRSDGTGSIDDIAEAAGQAGLQFINSDLQVKLPPPVSLINAHAPVLQLP